LGGFFFAVDCSRDVAIGTNRTNRADLMMSVPRGNPEVAFRGGQERF
jgi:hypothetical protein